MVGRLMNLAGGLYSIGEAKDEDHLGGMWRCRNLRNRYRTCPLTCSTMKRDGSSAERPCGCELDDPRNGAQDPVCGPTDT